MLAPFHLLRRLIWTAGLVMHFITIPGSFFQELAHQLACYLVGHRVLEVRYIVRDSPAYAGYVIHQGPSGVVRHLFIGIAPLLMGFAIWSVTLGLGWLWLHDGQFALWQAPILIVAAWTTAAATYAALPSPLDMEGVFQQPFSLLTIPCYLIAGPVWVIAHDYKLHLWGWTLWRVLVVVGTAYVIYLLVSGWFSSGWAEYSAAGLGSMGGFSAFLKVTGQAAADFLARAVTLAVGIMARVANLIPGI